MGTRLGRALHDRRERQTTGQVARKLAPTCWQKLCHRRASRSSLASGMWLKINIGWIQVAKGRGGLRDTSRHRL